MFTTNHVLVLQYLHFIQTAQWHAFHLKQPKSTTNHKAAPGSYSKHELKTLYTKHDLLRATLSSKHKQSLLPNTNMSQRIAESSKTFEFMKNKMNT
jgi:hypothetical protein